MQGDHVRLGRREGRKELQERCSQRVGIGSVSRACLVVMHVEPDITSCPFLPDAERSHPHLPIPPNTRDVTHFSPSSIAYLHLIRS